LSQPVSVLVRRAAKLASSGRPEAALEPLAAVLAREPLAAAALAIRSDALRRLGAWRHALEDLRSALALDPKASFADGSEEPWAPAARGLASRALGVHHEADAAFNSLLRQDDGHALAWGWLAEARLRQSIPMDAWRYTFEAELRFPDWPELHVWRGETLASLGRDPEAESSFTRGLKLGADPAPALLLRASCRERLGDIAGRDADLEAAVRAGSHEALGRLGKKARARLALGRLWMARARRHAGASPARALQAVSRAVEADPRDAGAVLLRAAFHDAAGRPDAARRDYDIAVALDGSAEAHAARAGFLRVHGVPMEAACDLARAAELQPSAERRLERGLALMEHRQYRLALADIEAASRLAPERPAAFAALAESLASLGRFGDAVGALERSVQLGADKASAHLRACELRALDGDLRGARRTLGGLPPSPARSRLEGWLMALERDWRGAVQRLDQAAMEAGGDSRAAGRARLYASASRLCASLGPVRRRRGRGRVLVCGLGVQPPGSLTVETARALLETDVAFNNVSDERSAEFLAIFCPRIRPVMFRNEQDVDRIIELLFEEASRGRTAAFATFGHPMVFGPLVERLLARAKESGVDCRLLSAYSSVDAMLRCGGEELGFEAGAYQLVVADPRCLSQTWSPRAPLFVELHDSGMSAWQRDFFGRLCSLYPKGHEALLLYPQSERWRAAPARVRLQELADFSVQRLLQSLLYVPPIIAGPKEKKP
jgi:tetratricopeptide (TPR) repeat protein